MSVKMHSLVKQVHSWRPDNGRWLATLSLRPSEVADRAGLDFHADTDDLGSYQAAFVRLSAGAEFMLRWDDHPTIPGTMVWGHTDATATTAQLHSLLAALNISTKEIVETSPDLKAPRQSRH